MAVAAAFAAAAAAAVTAGARADEGRVERGLGFGTCSPVPLLDGIGLAQEGRLGIGEPMAGDRGMAPEGFGEGGTNVALAP